jgi:hypothetical protein
MARDGPQRHNKYKKQQQQQQQQQQHSNVVQNVVMRQLIKGLAEFDEICQW